MFDLLWRATMAGANLTCGSRKRDSLPVKSDCEREPIT